MITAVEGQTFAQAWFSLLTRLANFGTVTSPRGIATRELTTTSLQVEHGAHNVLVCAERNPSYRFMLAEFMHIISGRDDVESIAAFNKNIANFSDNGYSFFGAYGPKVYDQLGYVVKKLMDDPDSRQAVLSIWREKPQKSKDIPCTLTYQALMRGNRVHGIVNMRSSDIWLGLPYDFFNFSMLTALIADAFYMQMGSVTFNLGSSHLYESDFEKAKKVLDGGEAYALKFPTLARMAVDGGSGPYERCFSMVSHLKTLFWEAVRYRTREHKLEPAMYTHNETSHAIMNVLLAETNGGALDVLKTIA